MSASALARSSGGGARGLVRDAGAVLLAWSLLVALEHLAVGFGYRALFAGTWEMADARKLVTPILLAALIPAAVVVAAMGRASARVPGSRTATLVLPLTAALAAGAVGWGVTTGRHFRSVPLRVGFVAALATVAFALARIALPLLARLARRRPVLLAALGLAAAAGAWCADAFVLPRLYPAFHTAMFAATLLAGAACALALPRRSVLGPIAVMLAGGCVVWTPLAARRLATSDNARLVLSEHAPLLGRGVAIAMRIAPPAPIDADSGSAASTLARSIAPGEIPRALDWSGRDIVLISVDALRADHVGAYGYRRATTPAIDRLAAEGTLFESAYCPTPHTSYSVSSMMTGKYMRPLLAVGLGADSDTWAGMLRRYGFRTAAFYPPAVFFIDEARFTTLRDRYLDFEYRKVEFASADARATQVVHYLQSPSPAGRSLFLWVHLFEPHEPYVVHPEHPFGRPGSTPTDLDAYDSEIAAADEGIGRIVDAVRAQRPGAIVIVTADHGEEFGEHGGRYHGTTVYEEQVRVPLVVAGEGIARDRRVAEPVQTIDLLPTTLSALGIPRPARLRGRDLGPLLTARAEPPRDDAGLAFAETDDYTLVARGSYRLVCARRAAACALYDPRADPSETHEVSAAHPQETAELRRLGTAIASEHGKFETGAAQAWPEALRRGMQGDADAAEEVASLLEDVDLDVRRKAAEVTFDLHAPIAAPQAKRAASRAEGAEDDAVRRFCALALVRMGEPPGPLAEQTLLRSPDPVWRRRAALAYAEQGDARGRADLAALWEAEAARPGGPDFEAAREILAALAKIKDRAAVPSLVRALDDVRLRPYVADALGAIGDAQARAPLLAVFAEERYVSTRPHEAQALVALGARSELRAPLARFAGVPEPMTEAVRFAYEARFLDGPIGGWMWSQPVPDVHTRVHAPGATRLLVLLARPGPADVRAVVGGHELPRPTVVGEVAVAEVAPAVTGVSVQVDLASAAGIRAAWLVPPAEEIPPPPPEPYDAGIDPDSPTK